MKTIVKTMTVARNCLVYFFGGGGGTFYVRSLRVRFLSRKL